MIHISDIEKGYISRLSAKAVVSIADRLFITLIAISIITGALYLIPGINMLDQFIYPGIFAVLLLLANAPRLSEITFKSILAYLLPALSIGVAMAAIYSTFHFMLSGPAIIGGYADNTAEFIQSLSGLSSMVYNFAVNSSGLSSFLFQSPIFMVATYIAIHRQHIPSMSLSYLMVINSIIAWVFRNFAPIILLIIMGEFLSRSGYILIQAIIQLKASPYTLLGFSLLLSLGIWFLFLVTKHALDEALTS